MYKTTSDCSRQSQRDREHTIQYFIQHSTHTYNTIRYTTFNTHIQYNTLYNIQHTHTIQYFIQHSTHTYSTILYTTCNTHIQYNTICYTTFNTHIQYNKLYNIQHTHTIQYVIQHSTHTYNTAQHSMTHVHDDYMMLSTLWPVDGTIIAKGNVVTKVLKSGCWSDHSGHWPPNLTSHVGCPEAHKGRHQPAVWLH